MSNLNPNIPSPELSKLMTTAAEWRKEYGQKLLTPQLLLRVFLHDDKSSAYQILSQLAEQRGFKLDELTRRVDMMAKSAPGRDAKFNFTDDFGKNIPLADETLVILDEGLTIAQARDEAKVTSGHALAAMCDIKVTTYGVLQRMGVSQAAVIALLDDVLQDSGTIIHDYVHEAQQGGASPVFQRETLLRDMISLLTLATKRHIILVGAEGAGKRTLVYSLGQLIAEGKGATNLRSVVQINEAALLENPLSAMRVGLRRANGGILLVPGIQRFFADRLRAPFPAQVNRDLQKAMLGNDHVIIGTTTSGDYDRLSQNAVIRQNTQRLDVPSATRNETISILSFHRQRLEQEYEITVTREALETAANLASQYMKGVALPAGAVQLVDRASATVRMVTQGHNVPDVKPDNQLDSEDVMVAASLMTKIPLTKLGRDEQSRYANMVDSLHERIIGQEEAILAVSRAVKTARVGLRDPKRPIGSFLFLGPSGVGKSELAKALAEFMFGSEDKLLTLDMSEYQGEGSVNRLIGSPPGYVGYEGGGQLTDFVRQNPSTVILFDEVEKAHNRIFDVLLQVLDEGRLTDGQGRLATFSETVVIMTSNLGSRHMLVPVIGEAERVLVMEAVKGFFRPEFLNRLDDVILFHQLTPDQLSLILDLMLKKEFRLAERQGLSLALTPSAKQWLLAQNDQPEYGARPLRRIIGRHLRETLADFLLREGSGREATVIVDANEAGLDFKIA